MFLLLIVILTVLMSSFAAERRSRSVCCWTRPELFLLSPKGSAPINGYCVVVFVLCHQCLVGELALILTCSWMVSRFVLIGLTIWWLAQRPSPTSHRMRLLYHWFACDSQCSRAGHGAQWLGAARSDCCNEGGRVCAATLQGVHISCHHGHVWFHCGCCRPRCGVPSSLILDSPSSLTPRTQEWHCAHCWHGLQLPAAEPGRLSDQLRRLGPFLWGPGLWCAGRTPLTAQAMTSRTPPFASSLRSATTYVQ